ncbi:MAG: tetratricopeptide repeat protein [Thermodesulfovibrionales bacterium]
MSIFIFILFLGVVALFAITNQDATTIKVPFGKTYEVSKIAMLLSSSAIGALTMLIIFTIRDAKRFIDNWQYQKKQKKEAEVQELYSKALNSLLAQDEDEAKEFLKGVLSKEPEHLNSLLRLGDIALSEEDFQKAGEYYQRAKNINPQNIETLFSLVRLSEKTGRLLDTLNYIEDILEIDDENLSALYKKREVLEKLGRWDELVSVQKQILKKEHTEKDRNRERMNLIGYKYEYGRQSLENNELEKAKKAFKTVLRLEKNFIPATLGLAEVLLREGETEEAINLLETSYEETHSIIVLARLEDLLINIGEPARLIRIYKNSLSKKPQDPVIRFLLGKLYYRLEMIDDAFDTFASMDTGSATYPELHILLGNLYLKRHQMEKAVHEFSKAFDMKTALKPTYCCQDCGFTSFEWSGRCENCKKWNTFQFNLDGRCKT